MGIEKEYPAESGKEYFTNPKPIKFCDNHEINITRLFCDVFRKRTRNKDCPYKGHLFQEKRNPSGLFEHS